MNFVLTFVLPLVATAVTATIGVAGTWLTVRAGKRTQLTSIDNAVSQLTKAAQDTVGELQQTLVNAWKEAQGGKLTAGQVRDLKAQLQAKTMQKLSEPVTALLNSAQADVSALITGVAESMIGRMKSEPRITIAEIGEDGGGDTGG